MSKSPKNVARTANISRPVDVANLSDVAGKVRPAGAPKSVQGTPFNFKFDWTGVTTEMLRAAATDALVVRLQGKTRADHVAAVKKNKAAKFSDAIAANMSGTVNVASLMSNARGMREPSEAQIARNFATVSRNVGKLTDAQRREMLALLSKK
jgi:hypothetical protein